jgi:serine/threonine protein kinase
VLRPDLGAVVGVERFLAEIQVTANPQHPNLLPLFDSGAAGDLLYDVMPYVQGESLRARLDREKQLPVDEAIRLATAIGSALDYAHRPGVIHRDLKPENVLLQEGQPLVADFGIALAVSNAGGTLITQTGLSLGTRERDRAALEPRVHCSPRRRATRGSALSDRCDHELAVAFRCDVRETLGVTALRAQLQRKLSEQYVLDREIGRWDDDREQRQGGPPTTRMGSTGEIRRCVEDCGWLISVDRDLFHGKSGLVLASGFRRLHLLRRFGQNRSFGLAPQAFRSDNFTLGPPRL